MAEAASDHLQRGVGWPKIFSGEAVVLLLRLGMMLIWCGCYCMLLHVVACCCMLLHVVAVAVAVAATAAAAVVVVVVVVVAVVIAAVVVVGGGGGGCGGCGGCGGGGANTRFFHPMYFFASYPSLTSSPSKAPSEKTYHVSKLVVLIFVGGAQMTLSLRL